MPTLTFCMTEEGKLPIGIKESLARMLPAYAGKKMRMVIEEYKETTSDKQRRYYFGVIVKAYHRHFALQGRHIEERQLHDTMMRHVGGFNNAFVDPFTGCPDSGRLSYNDLTKAQAEGYHTLCRQWAAEANPPFDIPEPHEYTYLQYMEGIS